MSLQSRKVYFVLSAALLATAGIVWGLSWSGDPDGTALPEDLTVDSLKARFQDPERAPDTMRATFNREDLSEEQRAQLRRNMGQVFRDMMNERVDEYFNASEDEKAAVLDRHIDEFQKLRERWERDRPEPTEEERQNWRERMRERSRNATQEQRKTRSESRNPEEMVRRMTYFTAVRTRMAERGIEMPRWGRGGRGGGRGGGRSGG